MEPRSRETTPTKEDLDFIVDDGYRHDVDPDYVPDEKYLVSGKEFKKLTRNAKMLMLLFSADLRKLALYTLKVEARKIGRECLVGRKV